jgi:hypothetical protein
VKLVWALLGIGVIVILFGGLIASNVWHAGGIVVMMIGSILVVAARWMST